MQLGVCALHCGGAIPIVILVDFSSCYYRVPGDDGKVPEAGALFVKSHRGAILNSGRATTNSHCPDATDGYLMLH